jgi:tetratricopeptide (TPR) repeat protein
MTLGSDPGLWTSRAGAYLNKKETEKAIADYTEAIRLDHDTQLYPYWHRGDAYLFIKDFDRAIADFTKAIDLADISDSWAYRGNAYRQKGDLDLALSDFSRAISLNPSHVYAYKNRALVRLDKEDIEAAIEDTSRAISINPSYSDLYANRCGMYLLNGELEAAIADCDEAISNVEKTSLAYRNRGRAFLYSGLVEKARVYFGEAAKLNPKGGWEILWLYIASRRANAQIQLSDSISQVDMAEWPNSIISFALGEITQSEMLDAAHDRADHVCDCYFFGGVLSLLRGKRDEAVRLLRMSVSNCPRYSFGWQGGRLELKMLSLEPTQKALTADVR